MYTLVDMRKRFINLLWVALLSLLVNAQVLYRDVFDNDGLGVNTSIGGGLLVNEISDASWTDDGLATFSTENGVFRRRAIMYSENAFQSDEGLKLTVRYSLEEVSANLAHNLSFGLVRSDTDLATYSGFNLFREDTSTYSIGVNLIPRADDPTSQGLTFSNGSTVRTLDQAGTNAEFQVGVREVIFAIGQGGAWSFTIDGVQEAAGIAPEGQLYYVLQ